jgi:diguanylate cyclase (GGDEF)-like protein
LAQSDLALDHFSRFEDAGERAAVLMVRASALRLLGFHQAAYAELEAYHALRARLEADAVQRYAQYVNARLGLERALAETESHRRIAASLETLGRIGQEITANLDATAVVRLLHRHVGQLLEARTFAMWLIDAQERFLIPADGIDEPSGAAIGAIPLADPVSPVARCVRERSEFVLVERSRGRAGRSTIFAPLSLGDRVLGALSIGAPRSDAYGDNERSMVRTLCTYGAIALDNAAAYREVGRVVSTLRSTQSELAVRTAEYERLSMTDSLTGLANRRRFVAHATVAIADARRNDGILAVAMFDIDHFKRVNDSHGHFVGDRVLQRLANVAKDALRPGDFIARIGGEEFALLLPGAGPDEAAGIAERIRSSFEQTAELIDGLDLRVTASFGVASFAAGSDTFDDAFARADGALYRAKQSGRNCVCSEPRT